MSDQLSMATVKSIETLHRSGHSNREIARLLGVDRGAVNKRVRQLKAESQPLKGEESGSNPFQNRPNSRSGSEAIKSPDAAQNRPNLRTGSDAPTDAVGGVVKTLVIDNLADLSTVHS